MLPTQIAETPANNRKNNTVIDESKGIDRPVDNHSEWYQIEVGTERANVMKCGNFFGCDSWPK